MQILQIKFTNVLHSCSSSPAPHIIFLHYFLLRPPNFFYPAMAATTTTPKFSSPFPSPSLYPSNLLKSPFLSFHSTQINHQLTLHSRHFNKLTTCKAAKISVAEEDSSTFDGNKKWVPVVPVGALPKGERRVIIQDGEEILLLWYKNQVFAIENRSPAEGAYTEGLINAKLTQDGCIVCPSTDSTFDLQTGAVKEWYPKNPVLRALTPVLRNLFVYPAKTDEENIYISITRSGEPDASAEIVFSGRAQPGVTASDVNVNEVRMVIDENDEGFGFTRKNELINGKAAILGFFLLLDFELLTGKGLLKGTGFLDFLYSISNAVN